MGLSDANAVRKIELGSAEWVDLAATYLGEAIPALGPAVEGVKFSMCEVFTNAPAHIADDAGTAAWWFRIDGPTVSTGRGARDDVDLRVDVEHADTLPWARMVYDLTDPEMVATLQQRADERREALGGGENPLDRLPPDVRAALTGLHNFLAPQTA